MNDKDKKSEARRNDEETYDLYKAAIMTHKCTGVLRYSHTPNKGEKLRCHGLENIKVTPIHAPGPVMADFALRVFENHVHYKRGFGGDGGGASGTHHGRGHARRNVNSKFSKHPPPVVSPEHWKRLRDPRLDEMQQVIDQHTNMSARTRSRRSSNGTGKRLQETKENTIRNNGELKSEQTGAIRPYLTKEIHANYYGVTTMEALYMTPMPKSKTKFIQKNHSSTAMKNYVSVPMHQLGVAKRSLKCIEHKDEIPMNDNKKGNREKNLNGDGIDNGVLRDRNHYSEKGKKRELVVTAIVAKLGFIDIDMQDFNEVVHSDNYEQNIAVDDTQNTRKETKGREQNTSAIEGRNDIPSSSSPKKSSTSPISSIIPTMQDLQEADKEAKELFDKFSQSSAKIKAHMYANAMYVRKEVQNNFVNRSMKSSERIVSSGEKIWERMKKNIQILQDSWKD